MLLTLCLLACGPDNLVRPSHPLATDIQQPVTNTPGCATVVVGVSGSSSASAAFPNDSGCHTGLVLLAGGAATYHRPGGGVFTLPVRVVNRSGMAVALPIRLELGVDSAVVLSPPGLAKNGKKGVTPTAPDSALPAGTVWLIGTGAALAAGDSTPSRDLTFAWDNGVHQARLGFSLSAISAAPADTSRPVMPATLAGPAGPTLLVRSPYAAGDSVYRNILGIVFWDSTSGLTIRSILARYSLSVIGGHPDIGSTALYLVQMPDPGPVLDSLVAFQARVQSEPGVRWATLMDYRGRIVPHARYPVDSGTAPNRADWFGAGTAATRSWLSVRAPLAWGCETGISANPLASVAVLDMYFDGIHQDLASSIVRPGRPSPGSMAVETTGLNALYGSHGTGIAGIIAAAGDNGQFGAGMVWRAKLQLLAFGHGDSLTKFAVSRFVEMVQIARDSGAQVLNLSTGVGAIASSIDVARIRAALALFMDSDAKRFVVLATGNDGLTLSLDQLAASTNDALTALDRAAAQLAQIPAYQQKMLFVTGAQSGHTLWGHSNVWTGADMIAAPAEQLPTLAGTNQMGVDSGTSIAAPFAVGLAAALWSSAPGLSGAQVKNYIVDGARQPRIDPATGVSSVPSPVGAGVYLLDAYGSLSLLSHDSASAPLCGVPVTWNGNVIHMARNTDDSIVAPGFAAIGFDGVSVAQGGRLISVFGADSNGDFRSVIVDQHGNMIRTLVDSVQRIFLERDTVDLTLFDNGIEFIPLVSIRRADGTSTSNVDLYAPNEPGATAIFNFVPPAFSPAGDWALVQAEYDIGTSCGPQPMQGIIRSDVVRLDGSGATLVRRDGPLNECGNFLDYCGDGCDNQASFTAWAQDARHAVLAVERDTAISATDLRRTGQTFTPVDLSGPSPAIGAPVLTETAPPNWLVHGLAYSSDGSVLYGAEYDAAFNCRSVVRSASSPYTLLSSTSIASCRQPLIFNSPAIAGGPAGSAISGFDLLGRIVGTARNAGRAARVRARMGPGMVVAN